MSSESVAAVPAAPSGGPPPLPIVDEHFILPGMRAGLPPKPNRPLNRVLVGVPSTDIIVVPETLPEGEAAGVGVRASYVTITTPPGGGGLPMQVWQGEERVSFTRGADGTVTWSPVPDMERADLAARVEAVKASVLAAVSDAEARKELEGQATPQGFADALAQLIEDPAAQTRAMQSSDPVERLELALDAFEGKIADDPLESVVWKLSRLPLNDDARKMVTTETATARELDKKDSARAASITYLKKVADLPWGTHAAAPPWGKTAMREILDSRHTGMPELKERVLTWGAEMLMVQYRNRTLPPEKQLPLPRLKPILIVGPPGTGKTTIAESIAEALGREFFEVEVGSKASSGGLNGFERTWSNSRQGTIMQKLALAGTLNSVLLLNEIDKLQSGGQNGNPSAPLMELTDERQVTRFTDLHFEFGFDLSDLIIMATANNLESIDPVLRNRFEVVVAPGYGPEEKRQIAADHVIPKLLRKIQVPDPADITVSDDAIRKVIDDYTSESGVRQVETHFDKVLGRAVSRQVDELGLGEESGPTPPPVTPSPVHVDVAFVEESLGAPKVPPDPPLAGPPGFGTAMYVSEGAGMGGIMALQVYTYPGVPGSRGVITTTGVAGPPEPGKPENGIASSIIVARDFVRRFAKDLHLDDEKLSLADRDIHMHFDGTATPKDGSSAGVAIAMTLTSSLWDVSMPQGWSMTGEISLDGRVLPIGGVNEKVLAAHRLGIRNVLIPESNVKDLKLADDVASAMNIHPVSTLEQAYKHLFDFDLQINRNVVPMRPRATVAAFSEVA